MAFIVFLPTMSHWLFLHTLWNRAVCLITDVLDHLRYLPLCVHQTYPGFLTNENSTVWDHVAHKSWSVIWPTQICRLTEVWVRGPPGLKWWNPLKLFQLKSIITLQGHLGQRMICFSHHRDHNKPQYFFSLSSDGELYYTVKHFLYKCSIWISQTKLRPYSRSGSQLMMSLMVVFQIEQTKRDELLCYIQGFRY